MTVVELLEAVALGSGGAELWGRTCRGRLCIDVYGSWA